MKKTFFSHDKNFYAALFPLLIIISLQNLISYSVNMADNIMLGAYSQNALSGAALVNQVFFLIQQAAVVIGDGLVVIASQYWGQKRMEPIRQITGMVLKIAFCLGIFLILLCSLFPGAILGFFTSDTAILSEAGSYLQIIKYTFLLYLVTQMLLSALRSVETVRIAFVISCVSLVVNVSINYTSLHLYITYPLQVKSALCPGCNQYRLHCIHSFSYLTAWQYHHLSAYLTLQAVSDIPLHLISSDHSFLPHFLRLVTLRLRLKIT